MFMQPYFAHAHALYAPFASHKSHILATLHFPCASNLVPHLVGPKWSRVKSLARAFQLAFPGCDIDITYVGHGFHAIIPNTEKAANFVERSFGEEVAIANHSMFVRPEFVGRLIGSHGHNLRSIEASVAALVQGCKCTIYYEDGGFRVRFPFDTPVEKRQLALQCVETRIYDHADYLEDRLFDSAEEYTDDGDWPELKPTI